MSWKSSECIEVRTKETEPCEIELDVLSVSKRGMGYFVFWEVLQVQGKGLN